MRVFKPKFKPPSDAILNPDGDLGEGLLSWKNTRNEFVVVATHYTSDPEKRSEEWYRKATKNLRPDQIEREFEIDFESKAGQKAFWYLEPNKTKFQIKDIPLDMVNPRWRIIAGLDYGSTNPTAFHIYGVDEMRKVYALYEFYKPSNYREIADVIKGVHEDFPHPLYKRIEKIMVDPSIYKKDQLEPLKEEMTSIGDILREEFGIWKLQKGQNDRKAGLERVKDMLGYRPQDPEWSSNLFFTERCENLWWELNNLVYEEIPPHLLMDKNQTEDTKKKDDHAYDACFVGDTLISTKRGMIPIADIRVGDLALTRAGYRPIIAAGKTGEKETVTLIFSNGNHLTCTGNHPIFTLNRGFVRADELSYADILLSEEEWKKKRFFSTGSFFVAIQNQSILALENISNAVPCILKKAFNTFIEKFGSIIMAPFLAGTIFTTKMGTAQTMTFPIWNAFQRLSTTRSTRIFTQGNGKQRSLKKFKLMHSNSQKNGMDQKRVEPGTVSTPKIHGKNLILSKKLAMYAGEFFKSSRLFPISPDFVETTVRRNTGENLALILFRLIARFAARFFKKISIRRPQHAGRNALGLLEKKPGSKAAVYNLSVSEKPEYFANGILVHNCRYALMSISAPAASAPEPRPEPGTLGDLEREFDLKDVSDDPDFI